ncbi:hypothetical protein BC830DRAFT_1084225 [Chytriomyces sp. MP71]|nr:hypothetical protein BC830DRAFT_1084225 [Chytriomyces sp. MP71]
MALDNFVPEDFPMSDEDVYHQPERLSLHQGAGKRASIDIESEFKPHFRQSTRRSLIETDGDASAASTSSLEGSESPAMSPDGKRKPSALKTGSSRRTSSFHEQRRRLSFMVTKDGDDDNDEPNDLERRDSRTRAVATARAIRNSFLIHNPASGDRDTTVKSSSPKDEEEESGEDDDADSDDDKRPIKLSVPSKPRSDILNVNEANTSNSNSTFAKNSRQSMQSDATEEGIIYDFLRRTQRWKENFLSTHFYEFCLWVYESTRFSIYVYTLTHIAILAALAIILKYGIGVQVSGIFYYNLIHAVSGFLGKVSFAYGLRATQLISKEFTARNMVKRGKGVSLTSIANPVPLVKLNADEGKTLRYLFIFALVLIEATVWFLGIKMEWIPTPSKLGMFPCVPVSYPTKPAIMPGLGNFMQGDSDLSMIYSYGLPLGDGVVGGFAAWPLSTPLKSFSITHAGVAFGINVVCGKLEVARPGSENGYTQFKIDSIDVWRTMFATTIEVQLPAGSHNWEEYADSDVTQECVMRYIMGDADIEIGFLTDQWGGVISQNVQSMTINGTTIQKGDSSPYYFGAVQDLFGVNSEYENITSWIIEGTQQVFNGTSYGTSQGATFANLFQWATEPDGLYHTEYTWRGMAAAVAILAHYILLQYNDKEKATCSYVGMEGAGVIEAPGYVVALTAGSVIICLLAELSQLFWWFLLSGGGEANDRAAKCLESPMQMFYDMRKGGTELLGELEEEDQTPRAIKRHYTDILVRFGESRRTRANPIGMLVLGEPGEVMAVNDKREYY